MRNGVRALDFMYYVATPEFIHRWNTAKTGELICRMERAIGGLPKYESIDSMIAKVPDLACRKSRSEPFLGAVGLRDKPCLGDTCFVL